MKNRHVDQEGEEEEEQKWMKKIVKKNTVYSKVTFSIEARSCGEVMLWSPLIKDGSDWFVKVSNIYSQRTHYLL